MDALVTIGVVGMVAAGLMLVVTPLAWLLTRPRRWQNASRYAFRRSR